MTQPPRVPLTSQRTEPESRLVRAAGIISLGNVASRVMGLAREFVKADLFGATGLVSAFEVANIVPNMIFDLLIGGMISSALVPVMSGYASSEQEREEFWRLVSTLLSVTVVCLSALVLLAEFFAPQIAWLFGARNFQDPALLQITARLLRIMLPAILFLNLAGLVTGVLFTLRRFSLPAFTAAVSNMAVVMAAILFPEKIDSLAWGVLLGSVAQVLLQLPAIELGQIRWRWSLQHPALGRLARLYLPIVLGILVSQAAIAVSYNLATETGDKSVATMRYATTLIQFPLGLVATAISVAILPTLSRQASTSSSPQSPSPFQTTLTQGLRLVLVLIIPATLGLFLLAQPIVALAFEHGDFLSADTLETAMLLRLYLLGLPFAAVDQLLIFAFYARKNTLSPALVGVLSVIVYLLIAMILLEHIGLYSLMIADSIKHMVHAGVMTLLLRRKFGSFRGRVLLTTGKAILASALMGLSVWATMTIFPSPSTSSHRLVIVIAGGAVGVTTYVLMTILLRIPEAQNLWNTIVAQVNRFSSRR